MSLGGSADSTLDDAVAHSIATGVTLYSDYGPCLDLFAAGTAITAAWASSDTATKPLTAPRW